MTTENKKKKPTKKDEKVLEAKTEENIDLDVRDYFELEKTIAVAQHNVFKQYLPELSGYPLAKPTTEMLADTTEDCVRLFKLQKFARTKGEDILQKLSTVYNATMALGCTLVIIVDKKSNTSATDIYLGVKNHAKNDNDKYQLKESFDALSKGIKAQFPGTELEAKSAKKTLIDSNENDGIFGEAMKCIASVSCVAAIRNKEKTEDKKFIQGIEKLIDVMSDNAFTVVFIAEPISPQKQSEIKKGYQEVYTKLSPFAKTNWSYSEEDAKSVMHSVTEGTSEAVTEGTSKTTGHSTTIGAEVGGNVGSNKTHGTSGPTAVARVGQVLGGISSVMSSPVVGGLVALIPGVGPVAAAAVHVVGKVSEAVGQSIQGGTVSNSTSKSIGASFGLNVGRTQHSSETDSTSTTKTKNEQKTDSEGTTKSKGKTIQIEHTNKDIEQLLERIDEQLERTKECEDFGAYNCGAYFLSNSEGNSLLAANTYRALMLGEGSSVESGAINVWSERVNSPDTIACMKEYLKRFEHPRFKLLIYDFNKEKVEDYGENDYATYTPSTIVSGLELPLHLGLPTKSVYGLPVVEHAEFGRNIYKKYQAKDERDLKLGNIYHMGRTEDNAEVKLDFSELTAHTFITGSTGSGKTNTVCTMLDKLNEKDVKFLVVEPAKGEYKDKLGGNPGVSVYGTNPKLTQMLKINPFKFPTKSIHILEHLDRLVEIFNVCWPMYAAMPAILKDAIERAYKEAGWDLITSENEINNNIFPSFIDVCKHIEIVVEESSYSMDNKSDYKGALVTRVNSLTNGLNGIIFSNDDIPDEDLFDKNVIIDLSRVGSTETKALIMGVLVLKLQEYRMSGDKPDNAPLKHITVLEEAHNLLKRTSTEQVSESSNLLGKSVEMLANSIAEMRTYGEGFVIADQSPGLLDMSVIRNTNTKIIMRLPDFSDRELVGKAAGLNDDQIIELGKLEQGVAAVMQSGWLEPVLCKIDKFEEEGKFAYNAPLCKSKTTISQIIKFVLSDITQETPDCDIDTVDGMIYNSNMPISVKLDLWNLANKKPECLSKAYLTIADCIENSKELFKKASKANNIEEWTQLLVDNLNLDLSLSCKLNVIECLLYKESLCKETSKENFTKWVDYMGRGVK